MEFRLKFKDSQARDDAKEWIEHWPGMIRISVAKRHENFIGYTTEGETDIIIKKIPEHLSHFFYHLRQDRIETIIPIYHPDRSGILRSLWPSGLFSDLTLKLGQKSFTVHRAILAVVSPYFKALFTHHPNESIIELKEVDPEIFRRVLDFIYGYPVEFAGLEGLWILVNLQRFELIEINPQALIIKVKVTEENLDEYISLVGQIYPIEYPIWFMSYLFDFITPSFNTPIETILKGLPTIFQRYFEETY